MSAQPNRKQQRLARELSKSEGVPYQAALARSERAAQQPTQDLTALSLRSVACSTCSMRRSS